MTLALVVAGLVPELVYPDFGSLNLRDDPAAHRGRTESRRVGGHRGAVNQQHRREADFGPGLARQSFHLEDVPHGDLVLLAARFHDRVHRVVLLAVRLSWTEQG